MLKNFLEFLFVAIPFIDPYPYWMKLLIALWIGLSGVIVIVFLFVHPQRTNKAQDDTATTMVQTATTVQGNVIQAGRDININNTFSKTSNEEIVTLNIEARLTCVFKNGVELPPAEVPFLPLGNSDAYLKGAAGNVRLAFISPVYFRFQEPDKVVVVNKFATRDDINIINRPIEALNNYNFLSLPIVSIVYGERFEKITLLELTLFINGKTIWYGNWHYDITFQQGVCFNIPLEQLHRKLQTAQAAE